MNGEKRLLRVRLSPDVAAMLDDFVTPDRSVTQTVEALIIMAHRKRFPNGAGR